ncbi:Uncharacterized protein C1F7.10 [Tolypocladium ophioglossoides CBS 100239]|uniref:Uncharacterized protein C1F7.10 n=1 Tax=Tolypocladium ophioglossoides (strain CBS 100239) TaxID=1163406 RepID=A0A0L0MYR1_TOLOC|nr:Uncharacterized protein C1F7.10 [Tolypocladium ophioglossoides CBS 100239]
MAAPGRKMKILLLNPNSSQAMTQAMLLAARATPISDSLQIDTYTAPAPAPASIDDDADIEASTRLAVDDMALWQDLDLRTYDAVLVACFSVHPLVAALAGRLPGLPVTGIFEASVLSALSLVVGTERWGIITTGKFWEAHLADGVGSFLGYEGASQCSKFCGVYSTGLTAGDFHTVSPDDIEAKLKAATKRLLSAGNVTCIAMGCGGMAGLEDIIRSAAREEYGGERAARLYIVDGVKAGILQLRQTISSTRTFL